MKDMISEKFFREFATPLELGRLLEEEKYIQHGNTSCYMHSLAVAYYSYKLVKLFNIPCDLKSLIRGAMLHDYFLYDWHEIDASHRFHGFSHPYKALENATKDYCLSETEKNIILRHMFPLTPIPPTCIEGMVVCLVDKVCSLNEVFKIKEYKIKLKDIA